MWQWRMLGPKKGSRNEKIHRQDKMQNLMEYHGVNGHCDMLELELV